MKCTLSIDVTDASLDEISRIVEAIETLRFGKHSPIRISYRAAQEWAEKVNAEPTTAPSEELPLNNNTTNKEN